MKILGNATSPLIFTATGDDIDHNDIAVWRAYTGQQEDEIQNWGWLAAVHPDDRVRVLSAWSQAVQEKNTYSLQYRLRRADNTYHLFLVQYMPIVNADRSLKGWATLYTDAIEPPVAEDENWEYKTFYSVLFAQTSVGIICSNLNGHFLRVNPYYCTMIGYSETELLNNINIWDIVHPDDLARSSADARALLEGGLQGKTYRMRCRRKGGTWIWVKATVTVMRKPSGEPTGYLSLVEDITAQVHAEEKQAQLLAREQAARAEAVERTRQLEAIFESMTDGVFVFDRDAHIIQVNSAARSFVPAAKYEDSWQEPIHERLEKFAVRDEAGQLLAPEKSPMFRILDGEILSGEQAMDVVQKHVEGYDAHVSITGAPVRDQHDTITGGVMVLRDVTERRQMEQRIQQSFQTLVGLAEALVRVPGQVEETSSSELPSELRIVSRTGRKLAELINNALDCWFVGIALVNQETMKLQPIAVFAVSAKRAKGIEEIVAKLTLTDVLDETIIAKLRANEVVLCDMLEQPWSTHYDMKYSPYALIAPMMIGEQFIGLLALQVKNKQRGYTYEAITLVKTVAKFVALVVERERLLQETLEARASELALREANKRFDEFLSIASHELRTPLTTIKGNIQLSLRRLQVIERQKFENVQALKEKLERIEAPLAYAEQRASVQNRMISDLLDISRIQANRLVLVMKPCNLVDIVRNAVRDERHAAPDREITLDVLTGEQVSIVADADRISQVIHNYLSNALKYSPMNQPVNVVVEQKGSMARVSVSDKGPGLSPQEQQRVWERFYRVKGIEVQSGSGIGLGLGLHICRMIVEYHHGQYGLESTVGVGSTFWFSLPVTQAAETQIASEVISSAV